MKKMFTVLFMAFVALAYGVTVSHVFSAAAFAAEPPSGTGPDDLDDGIGDDGSSGGGPDSYDDGGGCGGVGDEGGSDPDGSGGGGDFLG